MLIGSAMLIHSYSHLFRIRIKSLKTMNRSNYDLAAKLKCSVS